jgi:hypothetical protein
MKKKGKTTAQRKDIHAVETPPVAHSEEHSMVEPEQRGELNCVTYDISTADARTNSHSPGTSHCKREGNEECRFVANMPSCLAVASRLTVSL